MIRRNPISIKVKAPSKGLVTRWPSDTADRFNSTPPDTATLQTGMALQRCWSVAKNVRFEDGCIKTAPGYQSVSLSSSLLTNVLSHFRMDEATGTRYDAFGHNNLTDVPGTQTYVTSGGHQVFAFDVGQVAGKIGFAANFPRTVGAAGSFVNPYLISSSGSLVGMIPPVTAAFWLNCAAGSGLSQIMQWAGMTLNQNGVDFQLVLFEAGPNKTGTSTYAIHPGIGLPASTWVFVVLIVQAGSASIQVNGGAVNTVTPQGAGGSFVSGGPQQFSIANTANSVGFSIDSLTIWNVAVSTTITNQIYNSGTGLDFPFILGTPGTLLYEANLIVSNVVQRPLVYGAGSSLYSIARSYSSSTTPPTYTAALTSIFTGNSPSAGYLWRAADFFDKVIFAQHDNRPQSWIGGAASSLDLPGIAINSLDPFSASDDGNSHFDGCESFFGHLLLWHNDTLLWSDLNDFSNYIPIGITSVSAVLKTVGTSAFTQPAVGGTVVVTLDNSGGTNPLLAGGQFVRMIFNNGTNNFYNYYQVQNPPLPSTTAVTLKLLGTTGASAPGLDFTGGASHNVQTITTLDANEAGTSRIVGANVNGPILQVVALTDYAYIFKEWSIQSLQYIGQAQGTFFLRTEVTREGLIGRNALVSLGNGTIVFLGHRELYSYTGGPTPAPVCRQYTRQVLSEIDRSQLDQVILIHKEIRNEVWIVYPTSGGQKILVWNYVEDTATLDDYDPTVMGIKAGARVGWDIDPPWNSFSPDQLWSSMPDSESWAFFTGIGHQELTLLATGGLGLLVHGAVYDRDGQPYTALGETMDFDFDDNTVFKYPDTIHVGLQIPVFDSVTRNLYVQVGTRSTLDAAITWSTPKAINVKGGANFTAKINPGSGAGRYVRLRFYSQDADVNWQITSYEIYGRAGGTY